MVKLVCIDIDGTLLGTEGRVAERVWPAAARLARAGVHLAICTGRPAFGVARALAERLAPAGWHIFQNGASIMHFASRESRSAPLAPEVVAKLKARARSTGRILELYTDHGYAVESSSERAARHAELLGVPFVARSLDAIEEPIVRAQWLLPLQELDTVMSESHHGCEVGPSTAPDMSDTYFVNLTPPGIDKASGVRVLASTYGCALSDVMFVGDGQNDLPAMRIVGSAVAMGNADPAVRAFAQHQVADVDSGGLADALALALAGRGEPHYACKVESRERL
jgi:Cof subfamily protein (haloacid dehalogenase superfamily)